ncbi:MAG TPA: tetratricopeptide repeat protein [Candidatus Cybelea sp.]|nr:tetratricopeptide repeat protein [Candidatus Cybelea sp.]
MGSRQLAFEYALAAFDADAVAAEAQRRAVDDPHAAYELEGLLARRLSERTTHPDALAQAHWQMGLLANETAWREVPGSARQRAWLRRALAEFETAVRLAPLSERYAIADANQADLLGERARAAQLFRQAVALDPSSADAVAGLGVIAFENGDRFAARDYLARARALDAHSLMVRALERDLR